MAIAIDAASEVNLTSNLTSHTLAHTCSGTDRILLVGVSVLDSPYDVVTGVTYNGVSMSLIGKKFRTSNRGTYLYSLIAPSTGSNNIVVSCSSSVRVSIDGVSFTGVAQSGQPESFNTLEIENTTHTLTLTVSTDQSILVANAWTNRSETAGANTTLVGSDFNNIFLRSSTPVGTGSQSLVGTQSDTTWAEFVVAVIKPVATVTSNQNLPIMGVGS